MDTIRICPQCRKPVPQGAPEGLCPECLAKVALGTEPATPGRPTPPAPEQLAAQFPQLEIIELLGKGGMGMVYKARQPRLDRLVALKILPVASMPDATFGERFEREARALARLNHPGIVAIYDFGQTQDYYYFVMEFVDGMNLRQLLNAGTMTPRQALELVTQICTALQYAHDEKIVHRDIKPENVLINKKGQVKIADFGLAKLIGAKADTALTASQMVMGTLNYMAPEQREKPLEVDHRADIYSLGVVFYEMLTGEIPMGRFDAPSKKVQVDVRLDEVVLHALEREPARRYQQVSEVKSNVETITATMPTTPPQSHAASASVTSRGMPKKLPFAIKALLVICIIPLASAINAAANGEYATAMVLASYLFILVVAFAWHANRQIAVARENGWWPKMGEAPTIEHVKRLAQAGEAILAIRLYRRIFDVPLADAKAAVEKLASRPVAQPSQPQSQKPQPQSQAPLSTVFRNITIGLIALVLTYYLRLPAEKTGLWWLVTIVKFVWPVVFFTAVVAWLIERQKGGLKFRDLPPRMLRRMVQMLLGLLAAVFALQFFLITLLPIKTTETKQWLFYPGSRAYQKLGLAGTFSHYDRLAGAGYYIAPTAWKATVTIYKTNGLEPSLDVNFPGLRAEYSIAATKGSAITTVLDREVLANWLRDQAHLDTDSPQIQTEASQLMQLLKSYENAPPHTAEEFLNLARADLRDFSIAGFRSNGTFDSSMNLLIVLLVLMLTAYFGLAAWIVHRTFEKARKATPAAS